MEEQRQRNKLHAEKLNSVNVAIVTADTTDTGNINPTLVSTISTPAAIVTTPVTTAITTYAAIFAVVSTSTTTARTSKTPS